MVQFSILIYFVSRRFIKKIVNKIPLRFGSDRIDGAQTTTQSYSRRANKDLSPFSNAIQQNMTML